jgi:inhibitor of KinA
MEKDLLYPKILPIGDSGLEVIFGNSIDAEINRRVHAFNELVMCAEFKGIIETIPCYCSLFIIYDPENITWYDLSSWIFTRLSDPVSNIPANSRLIEIGVYYGGVDGPDLEEVALYHHLTPTEVISMHSSVEYRLYMMGFTPGFPYLGGLNPLLTTPRLSSPRKNVPAGSVGIAGNQTGIYPLASPGGWRIIGRTEQALFSPENDPPFYLRPGDIVRFIPLGKE